MLEKQQQQGSVPDHIAVIMDGNGRWAAERGLGRSSGHREGMEAIRRVTKRAHDHGIKVLSLYAFSTENWKRPMDEIKFIMNLPDEFFDTFVPELIENNIKVTRIGIGKNIPSHTKKAIDKAIEQTKDCDGMILNFAFNYGGRMEISETMKMIAEKVQAGELKAKEITEDLIRQHLSTNFLIPYDNVDLLIRSSGELRISNFLLWQNAYSEFYFTNTFWPDFDEDIFDEALLNYQNRNRRYGKV